MEKKSPNRRGEPAICAAPLSITRQAPGPAVPYLGLEIVGVVVGVLGVHWLLVQAFAHVAGVLLAGAGNSLAGCSAPGPFFLSRRYS